MRKNEGVMFFGNAKGMFLDLAEASTDLVFIADWKRTILFVNAAACAKTGYKSKELVGAKMQKLYRKENASKYTSKIFKDLYDGGSSLGEIELVAKDGQTFHTLTKVSAYRDSLGKPVGMTCIAKDLTTHYLATQKSLEEESWLHQIIDSMEDAVCVCDDEGRVRLVNTAHCRMIGFSKEEILGSKPPYPWVDGCCGDTSLGLKRLHKEGRLKNYFATWKTRKNEKLNVSISMSYLRNGSPEHFGHVCIIRDVSEVHYSDDLRQSKEQLHRLFVDVKLKAVRLETLEEINRMVLKNATAAQVFKSITSSVAKLVQHDLAGFYSYDEASSSFVPHTLSKKTPFSRKLGKLPLRCGEGIIGEAAVSGKLVWVNNAQLDPRSKYPLGMKPEKEHFIAVPLKGRKSVFGVLVVSRNRDPEFIEEEALVVKSLADAATVALENARLFQAGSDIT